MLRIIIKTQDFVAAVHIKNAEAQIDFKTFDVSLPELEDYLRLDQKWIERSIVGIELLD